MVKGRNFVADNDLPGIHQAKIEALLQKKVVRVDPLEGGNNSRTYCLNDEEGCKILAKFYHRSRTDARDRLDVEFRAFTWLRNNGIETVPRGIARDDDGGFGLYEFVQGQDITASNVTDADLSDAVDFLCRVKGLSADADEGEFAEASEAMASFEGMVHNIEERLYRLQEIDRDDAVDRHMENFLAEKFIPVKDEVVGFIRSTAGSTFTEELSPEYRTLSPSDFGFHNALRTDRGIVYFDFEYFGWDDPSKMVSDFLWHPAMGLGEIQKEYFYRTMIGCWHDPQWLDARTKLAYPIIGLKWCMIFLNEFVRNHLQRRTFARGQTINDSKVREQQLQKAENCLKTIQQHYRKFPYGYTTVS